MKVSVVIPCHNSVEWIGDALRSVEAQTSPPHEIIVVDDKSTDDSAEAARAACPRAVVLRTEFGNAAAARNAGIQAAIGDLLAFLDADDMWKPDHLATAVDTLRATENDAYFAHFARASGGTVRETKCPFPLAVLTGGLRHDEFLPWFASTRHFCNSTLVARRSTVSEIGGYNASLKRRHDIEMFLRLIHRRKWAYNPGSLAIVRTDNPMSISKNRVECSRFLLMALQLNRDKYASIEMDAFIKRASRIAVGAAARFGNPRDLKLALSCSVGAISPVRRAAYRLYGGLRAVVST